MRKTWRPRGKPSSSFTAQDEQMSSIIFSISTELKSAMLHFPLLVFIRSRSTSTLHNSISGTGKYFKLSLTTFGVKLARLSPPISILILSRVLPHSVLLSSLAKLARYLMLVFKPTGKKCLGMGATRDTFDEVAVCSPWQAKHISHCNIPRLVDPFNIL